MPLYNYEEEMIWNWNLFPTVNYISLKITLEGVGVYIKFFICEVDLIRKGNDMKTSLLFFKFSFINVYRYLLGLKILRRYIQSQNQVRLIKFLRPLLLFAIKLGINYSDSYI